jgi:hypothetical protein
MIQFNILKNSVKKIICNNGNASVYDTYILGKFYFYLFCFEHGGKFIPSFSVIEVGPP